MRNLWKKEQWQDLVLGGGQIVFIVGLMTSVLTHYKPAPFTCVSTAAVLASFIAVYISYRLWFTLVMNTFAMALWIVLAIQVIK
jgi:hypothetical protein